VLSQADATLRSPGGVEAFGCDGHHLFPVGFRNGLPHRSLPVRAGPVPPLRRVLEGHRDLEARRPDVGKAGCGEEVLHSAVGGERAGPAGGARIEEMSGQVWPEDRVEVLPSLVPAAEGRDPEPAAGDEQLPPGPQRRTRVGQEEDPPATRPRGRTRRAEDPACSRPSRAGPRCSDRGRGRPRRCPTALSLTPTCSHTVTRRSDRTRRCRSPARRPVRRLLRELGFVQA
jgi:hypothetical protein